MKDQKLKIVIISRVIHPVQSPRSFRTTELANELSRQGHDVTIYAVLGKYDYTKYEKDTRVKVKNIGKMLFATKNSDGFQRYNFIDKILFHLFNFIFEFPDIEFLYRIPKLIKNLENIDKLITIAVPHPIHWGTAIGKLIYKNKFPKTWIADCGDPYMLSSFSSPSRKYLFHLKFIEKLWCENSDFISIPTEDSKNGYYPQFHNKIKIIPQGFNISSLELPVYKKNSIPIFIYAGGFYGHRKPNKFLDFLCTLNDDFKFILYTKFGIEEKYLKKLSGKLIVCDYIPRNEILIELSKADFLINFSNPDSIHLPSKLIDYYIVKRPILEISLDFKEHKEFVEFLNGNYKSRKNVEDLEKYNIKNVAKSFIDLV